MGLWDFVKDSTKKAKCKIGFHEGTFATPEGKPACYLEKKCSACGEVSIKNEHAYENDWSIAPFDQKDQPNCTRTQECIYCKRSIKKISHERFTTPALNRQCLEITECIRCGEIRKGRYKHKFENIGTNAKCQTIKRCTECGKEEIDGYNHHFIRDSSETGKIVMLCVNCGKTETRKYI